MQGLDNLNIGTPAATLTAFNTEVAVVGSTDDAIIDFLAANVVNPATEFYAVGGDAVRGTVFGIQQPGVYQAVFGLEAVAIQNIRIAISQDATIFDARPAMGDAGVLAIAGVQTLAAQVANMVCSAPFTVSGAQSQQIASVPLPAGSQIRCHAFNAAAPIVAANVVEANIFFRLVRLGNLAD